MHIGDFEDKEVKQQEMPWDLPGGSDGKESAYNAGDLSLILGLGRSSGGAHGNLLQYSGLENPWSEEPGGLQSMGLQRVEHD